MNVNWHGVFPQESVALMKLARAGHIEAARELYRWFMPLLRLNTIPKLVQAIKLTEQIVDRGSEKIRAPRLSLIGEERAYVEKTIQDALDTRTDLSRFNLG